MRRILVPLDGTAFAAAILPDARRLAGPDGVLILLDEVGRVPYWDPAYLRKKRTDVQASGEYLRAIADGLRAEHVKVETQSMLAENVARTIDEAAMTFDADMVAVATHVSGALGSFPPGSIAWEALAHSPVPVLIRHITDVNAAPISHEPGERRIMVPLDGSALAEKALPLAGELAAEWNASIWLVHVVSHYPITDFARTEIDPDAVTDADAARSSKRYLDRIASRLGGDVQTHVLLGSPVDKLVTAAATWTISDIVLSSHGRTGPAHAVLGSVADSLFHHLDLPMIVVPAGATEHVNQTTPDAGRRTSMATGEKTQSARSAAARKGEHTFKNIVVALDGSKEAEAILPYIESIARTFGATVTFVCALVPVEKTLAGEIALSEGGMAPGMMEAMYDLHDELGKDDASYLATMTKRWAAHGFDVAYEEPQMRAAEAIVQVAREKGADLIAMATHGRSGMGRTVLGSVADEVVRTAPCPVLLLRPERAGLREEPCP